MKNDVYDAAVTELRDLFGRGSELPSGTGVRFTSAKQGKLTVYHDAIAAGNRAEIAFGIDSLTSRTKKSHSTLLALVAELRAHTGRPVDLNAAHGWPRVGLSSIEHVKVVMERLRDAGFA